tara:strand:- start:63 stop:1076 length:1014 start_codon:yes stop_codon:yes gene_type:complete
MAKKKDNIIIIVIVSIVIVGGVLTWGFLTNWGQGKKSEPVKYTVPKKIPKGNKIEIENPESYGFKIGQEIEIGTGESRETRTIVGFGSLILDQPLTREYPENTVITVVAEPIKKDFKVDNCHEYTVDLMCKECGDSYYLEYNKCKKYSHKENDCSGERQIFRKGTYTSDSQCEDCGKEQWIKTLDDGTKQCTSYKYTSENCKRKDGKIFTAGTSLTSDNSTCKDCITECKFKKIEEETQQCTKLRCKFSNRNCTSCSGGGCDQTNCDNPTCSGGGCDQSGSVNPRCNGGWCKQNYSNQSSCPGGHCYSEDCKDNCRNKVVNKDMVALMCSRQCGSNQ